MSSDIIGDCYIREGNGCDHRVVPNAVSQLVSDANGYEIYDGVLVHSLDLSEYKNENEDIDCNKYIVEVSDASE